MDKSRKGFGKQHRRGSAPEAVHANLVDHSYWRVTRSATYGFLAALPLLVLYEVMIVSANRATGAAVRVGADVWVKQFLSALGTYGAFGIGIAVCLVGVAVVVKERHLKLPLKVSYFGRMIGESAVYAVVVGLIIAATVGRLMMASGFPGAQQQIPIFTQLALSIGAGLYEELVFRVILVGGLYWILKHWIAKQMKMSPRAAYVVAAIVGALLFSWVHYLGSLGDVFTISSFTFRFLFGLALNLIFLIRGFGVAAWTHALYDVYVVTGLFSLL